MIKISNFSLLVKTFFKNIFPFQFPFEQRFKLFFTKVFKTLFKVYAKRVDDTFFILVKERINLKAEDLLKELLLLPLEMSLLNVANM